MYERIRSDILFIFENTQINMSDIHSVQKYALEQKLYDLVVYINNNSKDYFSFVKTLNQKKEV